jgi:hypothetical protein
MHRRLSQGGEGCVRPHSRLPDLYGEAHREERRAVGMSWPVARMRVSPSPQPWHLTYRYG